MTEYTIDSLVTEWINIRGENENKRKRLDGIAVWGLRNFNITTSGVIKVCELHIGEADFANLPLDYMQYSKVALSCNGILYSLGLNNSLTLNKAYDACGKPIPQWKICHCGNNCGGNCTGSQGNGTCNNGGGAYNWYTGANWGTFPNLAYQNTMRNGEFMGRMFGIGSDNNVNGYYRIDRETNQILFGGLCKTSTVVLEYVADINAVDGSFAVHPYCISALFAFIRWQLDPNNQIAERQYLREAKAMRLLFGKFNVNEWESALQSANTMSPKLGLF